MITELNFPKLKSAYYELIRQYIQLLNQVFGRKTDSILRILVEVRVQFYKIC